MRVFFNNKQMDFPKKINDLQLNWYQQGKICIAKNRKKPKLQVQNTQIKRINQIVRQIWNVLTPGFKKDLSVYALSYKHYYPTLRKRGVSSYSCFLILIHSLIKRFGLKEKPDELMYKILCDLLAKLSVYQAVCLNLLKKVAFVYQLNQEALFNGKSFTFTHISEKERIVNSFVSDYKSRVSLSKADDG